MSWTIERATMAKRLLEGTYYLAGAYAGKDRRGRKRTIKAMIAAGEAEAVVGNPRLRHRLTQRGMDALNDFQARFEPKTTNEQQKHLGRV